MAGAVDRVAPTHGPNTWTEMLRWRPSGGPVRRAGRAGRRALRPRPATARLLAMMCLHMTLLPERRCLCPGERPRCGRTCCHGRSWWSG